MKVIYKYPIRRYPGQTTIEMYKDKQILKLDYDPNGILCIWTLVDTELEKENVTIALVGTGWPLDELNIQFENYITTINDGPYVWHAFEVK